METVHSDNFDYEINFGRSSTDYPLCTHVVVLKYHSMLKLLPPYSLFSKLRLYKRRFNDMTDDQKASSGTKRNTNG